MKFVPQIYLNQVYRCPFEVVELVGSLFYKGLLFAYKKKELCSIFLKMSMKQNPPPVVIVDTRSWDIKVGTSRQNMTEAELIKDFIWQAMLSKHDTKITIGVVCLYAQQANSCN